MSVYRIQMNQDGAILKGSTLEEARFNVLPDYIKLEKASYPRMTVTPIEPWTEAYLPPSDHGKDIIDTTIEENSYYTFYCNSIAWDGSPETIDRGGNGSRESPWRNLFVALEEIRKYDRIICCNPIRLIVSGIVTPYYTSRVVCSYKGTVVIDCTDAELHTQGYQGTAYNTYVGNALFVNLTAYVDISSEFQWSCYNLRCIVTDGTPYIYIKTIAHGEIIANRGNIHVSIAKSITIIDASGFSSDIITESSIQCYGACFCNAAYHSIIEESLTTLDGNFYSRLPYYCYNVKWTCNSTFYAPHYTKESFWYACDLYITDSTPHYRFKQSYISIEKSYMYECTYKVSCRLDVPRVIGGSVMYAVASTDSLFNACNIAMNGDVNGDTDTWGLLCPMAMDKSTILLDCVLSEPIAKGNVPEGFCDL